MTLETHQHCRILLIDSNRYDRELLSLSLRNHLQQVAVLAATSALDFAEHLAAGTIDAVISEIQIGWSSPFELIAAVRRQNAACAFCLFTNEQQQPSDRACVGHGVDANLVKNSAGFLELPRILDRVFSRNRDLQRLMRASPSGALVDVVPLGTLLVNDNGSIEVSNLGFERMLLLPRYRFSSGSIADLIGSDDGLKWQQVAKAKHKSGDMVAMNVHIANGDGRDLAVRFVARPLVMDAGMVRLWGCVLLDDAIMGTVAERPIAATRRDTAEPALELGYVLSHDLQQPLQNVVRQARWLLEHHGATMSAEARASATHIYDSANRIQEMVDGAVSLLRVGQVGQRWAPVDLNLVLHEAIDNLKPTIEDSAATIECDKLPTVMGNHGQLVQLFQNLFANGIKFHGDRLPRIRVTGTQASGATQVRVQDNGIGIRKEDQARVFELYQRLHTDEEYPGTGVGLAICKRIIESHGGKISVESVAGRGSIFILDFPPPATPAA